MFLRVYGDCTFFGVNYTGCGAGYRLVHYVIVGNTKAVVCDGRARKRSNEKWK